VIAYTDADAVAGLLVGALGTGALMGALVVLLTWLLPGLRLDE
jgi:hypothetical protein